MEFPIVELPTVIYEPVGVCIYCGTSGVRLTDEHIVPLSLNGKHILPKSSCDDCSDITKRFEQSVVRNMYGVLRMKKGFKTRRPKDRKKFDLTKMPLTYFVPVLPAPGILAERMPSDTNPELTLLEVADPEEIRRIAMATRDGLVRTELVFEWGALCRLLAKIAHGVLVSEHGVHGYTAFLPDLILGKSAHLSHYIGGFEDGGTAHFLHYWFSMGYRDAPDGGVYAIVIIHLLANVNMPSYQVVAAKFETDEAFAAAFRASAKVTSN